MKRITTGIAVLACAALIFGCGGGGASAPAPGGDNGGNPNPANIGPGRGEEYRVDGDHNTSAVPGQFSLATAASMEELKSLVEPMGFSVLSMAHSHAVVQAPAGMDGSVAQNLLEKQYTIGGVEPVKSLHTARPMTVAPWMRSSPVPAGLRGSSRIPLDPWFSDRAFVFAGGDATNGVSFFNWFGTGMPLTFQGFNSSWDVAENQLIEAQPVKIAIVDAGWFDYSTDIRGDLDEATQLDAVNSGSVDGAGNFTAGFAAATFETFDNPDDALTPEVPIRDMGEVMLGILAAGKDSTAPRAVEFDDPADGVQEDEVFNEGIAGINDSSGATYMLIKTGSASGNSWTFTDAEIAESIDHAVAGGANIILLGMFANGAPSGQLSTAIAAARAADVLVIAPAGDVASTATFDTTSGAVTGFGGTPVDIRQFDVTPASDPNVVSVSMTGYNRFPGGLGDIDWGNGDVPNVGNGWTPVLGAPLNDNFGTVMSFSNTGGTIAAVGYGIGYGVHPILTDGGGALIPAERPFSVVNLDAQLFVTPVFNFSTSIAAAYVAGAASQVFQILAEVNGTPPTDDEVLNELLTTVQFAGLTGVDGTPADANDDGGLLNAGAAATSAINGGNLNQTFPAMQFTSVVASQPFAGVTRGTDDTLTMTVVNGEDPLALEIDWGNGDPPVVVDPWVSGTAVTLTGGYDTLGPKAVTVTVTDNNGNTASIGIEQFVINPLSCNIGISDAAGIPVAANAVQLGVQYRLTANASNVYTGEIGGTPNTTTFNWNLDGDAAYEATGPSPTFTFDTPGAVTVTLDVVEDVRPGGSFTLAITVN